jgi:hypothetical protein
MTPTELVLAKVKSESGPEIRKAITRGMLPMAAVGGHLKMGARARSVPLNQIKSFEWHADDPDVKVLFRDAKGEDKSETVELGSKDQRKVFVDLLDAKIGPCAQEVQAASVWHVGAAPMWAGLAALVALGVPGVMGVMNDGPLDTTGVGRRTRLMNEIVNAVGPVNILIILAVALVGLGIWWFIGAKNPPNKYTHTPTGQGGTRA